MASPRTELPPGASPSSPIHGTLPSVFTIDAIDMQGAYTPSLLARSNGPTGYYPKKQFQAVDDIVVSLLQQGFVGCTPVRPQLAVATNVYEFYTAARGVHPSFSIEAFARTLCLVHKVGRSCAHYMNDEP